MDLPGSKPPAPAVRVAAGQGQGPRVRAGMSLEGRVRAQMSGPQVSVMPACWLPRTCIRGQGSARFLLYTGHSHREALDVLSL